MKGLFYILSFFCICALASCASKENRTADKAENDSTILQVGVTPTFDCLPFYVAKETGLFDSLQAKVDLKIYGSAMDADTAFRGKTVDALCTDLCHVTVLKGKGYGLNVISALYGRQALIGSNAVRVRKLKDLKEKMIAIAREDQSKLFIQQVLRQQHIGSDITYLPQINNFQIRYNMLNGGQVDAAVLPEPYATLAQLKKNKVLTSNEELGWNLSCLIASSKAQRDKNVALRRMMTCYNAAVKEINKAKAGTYSRILSKYYAIPKQIADTLHLPKYNKATLPATKDVKRAVGWIVSEGATSKRVNANGLLTDEYIR